MRRLAKVLATVTALVVSFQCLPVFSQARPSEPPRPIVVGSETGFPPYADVDSQCRAFGFSVDLFSAVARVMDLPIAYRVSDWDSAWNGLLKGDIDALPVVARLPAREGMVEFTQTHTIGFDCFFVRKGEAPLRSIEDARGRRIIVMRSDAAHHALAARGFTGELVFAETLPDALRTLAAGQNDAVLAPLVQGTRILSERGFKGIQAGPPLKEYRREFAFAVKKGNKDLRDRLDQGLLIERTSGEYQRIYDHWLGIYEPSPFPVREAAWAFGGLVVVLLLFGTWNWTLRQGRKRLRETNAYLENLINFANAPIIVWNPEFRITRFNRAFEALTGRTEAEVLGKSLEILFPPELTESSMGLIRKTLTGERWEVVEIKILHLNGTIRTVLWNSATLFTQDGRTPLATIAQGQDITERKRAEQVLRASEEKYRAIMRSAHDAIVTVDQAGNIVGWNQGAETLFGYKESEALGKPATIIIPEGFGDGHLAGMHRIRSGGSHHFIGRTVELVGLRKNQSECPVELSLAEFETDLGWHATAIIRDITDRKQAELEIEAMNRNLERMVEERTATLNAALGELEAFSYSVSHDLRTPLRSIAGFVELLKETISSVLDAESRHYLDMISSSSKMMGRLIDDLLDFSRMKRWEMSAIKVDLQQVATEVIQEAAADLPPDRVIDWRIGKLPVVTGDRTMLRQVLANLISNALKYSSLVEAPVIEVGSLTGDPKEWTFYVRDNGAGFDMRHANKLFKLFERLHSDKEFEGLGVGLAIVRHIIERHGGRTWPEGEVNKGATFYFTLKKESL